MADTKISELPAAASVAAAALFPIVQAAVTEKATALQVKTYVKDAIVSDGTFATDTAVVHLAGTETVTGAKAFSADPTVPDSVYGVGWNGSFAVPTKNAVYDQLETMLASIALKAVDTTVVHNTGNETVAGVKTFSSDPIIPDEVYGAGWNGSLEPPTKNAVYDKIETISGGSGLTQQQVLVLDSMMGF